MPFLSIMMMLMMLNVISERFVHLIISRVVLLISKYLIRKTKIAMMVIITTSVKRNFMIFFMELNFD